MLQHHGLVPEYDASGTVRALRYQGFNTSTRASWDKQPSQARMPPIGATVISRDDVIEHEAERGQAQAVRYLCLLVSRGKNNPDPKQSPNPNHNPGTSTC